MRVGIVDDSDIFGRTLTRLVDREPDLRTVARIESSSELDTLVAAAPDIVFLDVDLGREHGLDLLPTLLARIDGVRIIVITGQYSPEIADAAIAGGALACFTKHDIVPLLKQITVAGADRLVAADAASGRVAPH